MENTPTFLGKQFDLFLSLCKTQIMYILFLKLPMLYIRFKFGIQNMCNYILSDTAERFQGMFDTIII